MRCLLGISQTLILASLLGPKSHRAEGSGPSRPALKLSAEGLGSAEGTRLPNARIFDYFLMKNMFASKLKLYCRQLIITC